MKIAKEPISMETPIGDDEDSHLGDFIEDGNTLVPGSSPGGPTRKANPHQKWWGFCHLSVTLTRILSKIFSYEVALKISSAQ